MTRPVSPEHELAAVGRAWLGDAAVSWQRLESDGFSGAPLLRVSPVDDAAAIVLKPFPPEARPRLEWVHRLMRHLRSQGCAEVPEVLVARGGGTVVAAEGAVWEAVRFVAGRAADPPTAEQAAAALEALARIHLAAAAWPEALATRGLPPAVQRRRDQAVRLLATPWQRPAAVRPGDTLAEELVARLDTALAIARESGLTAALQGVVSFPPPSMERHAVLRDVWTGHVLFGGERPARVAGIVDYQAAAIDTPATDVARLIGSWQRDVGSPPDAAWAAAVAAYERVRPLPPAERRLIRWLDATGTILGLDNWFRWVFEEGRQFGDAARVLGRVERLLACLPAAIVCLARHETAV